MRVSTPNEIDLEEFEQFIAAQLGRKDAALLAVNADADADADVEAKAATTGNVFDPYTGAHKNTPHLVYFLHYSWVADQADGKLKIAQKAYAKVDGNPLSPRTWKPIDVGTAKRFAEELTTNARLPQKQQNPDELNLVNFYDNHWTRVCYVVLVMDSPGWAIAHSASTQGAAVVFYEDSGSKPNHSFYDGQLFEIRPIDPSTGNATPVTAMLMVNYMVDENDTPIQTSEEFRFKMAVTMPTLPNGGKGLEIDPGGINEGPPEQP